jgi:hypothetical protein
MPTGIATRGRRAGQVFESLTITLWLTVASNVPSSIHVQCGHDRTWCYLGLPVQRQRGDGRRRVAPPHPARCGPQPAEQWCAACRPKFGRSHSDSLLPITTPVRALTSTSPHRGWHRQLTFPSTLHGNLALFMAIRQSSWQSGNLGSCRDPRWSADRLADRRPPLLRSTPARPGPHDGTEPALAAGRAQVTVLVGMMGRCQIRCASPTHWNSAGMASQAAPL